MISLGPLCGVIFLLQECPYRDGCSGICGKICTFYRLSSRSQNNSRTDQQRNGTVLPLNLLNSLIFPLEKSGGGEKTELQFIITAAKLHDQPWTLWLRHLGVRHLASSPFQSEGLKNSSTRWQFNFCRINTKLEENNSHIAAVTSSVNLLHFAIFGGETWHQICGFFVCKQNSA